MNMTDDPHPHLHLRGSGLGLGRVRRRCPPATVPTCHGTHPHPHPHLAGGYDTNICDEVTAAAQSCIEEKGSFSLCIPGGSVVAALANLKADGADWTKMHVFFCNEKARSLPDPDPRPGLSPTPNPETPTLTLTLTLILSPNSTLPLTPSRCLRCRASLVRSRSPTPSACPRYK